MSGILYEEDLLIFPITLGLVFSFLTPSFSSPVSVHYPFLGCDFRLKKIRVRGL